MKELKRQIRESFFNPILYFLPALVFIVADDFWGEIEAWKISFPIALGLMFYVYFRYRKLFLWHGMLAVCYLIIGLVSSLVSGTYLSLRFIDEWIFLLLMFLLIFQKNRLGRIASKTLPHKLPMSNNENELFRVAKVLIIIVSVYSIFALYFELSSSEFKDIPLSYLKYFYAFALVFITLFETIRVLIIRSRLLNEDWLPIVNTQGKVIGSVQYQPNVLSEVRHLHPVVRLYFIEKGMIYLQQRKTDDISEPLLWDASLSRRVRMSESIDMVLKEYTLKLYNQQQQKFLFLTNYIYEGKFSNQLIYLFVSCKTEGLQPQENEVFQTKWWTTKQIEDNLGIGVFTERFEKEFDILKRSGLLEEETCDCECALKDMIKNKLDKTTI